MIPRDENSITIHMVDVVGEVVSVYILYINAIEIYILKQNNSLFMYNRTIDWSGYFSFRSRFKRVIFGECYCGRVDIIPYHDIDFFPLLNFFHSARQFIPYRGFIRETRKNAIYLLVLFSLCRKSTFFFIGNNYAVDSKLCY